MLIRRNQLIQEHINKKVSNTYPLVIFHEGNITPDARKYITDKSRDQIVRFVDVSGHFSGGYEGMCQFNTLWLWHYCKEYDIIMRVDDDCHITRCDTDPFGQVGEHSFVKSADSAEAHSETNATLPEFVEKLTGANRESFYNDKYPYTNVLLAKPSFFLNDRIWFLLTSIATDPMQRANRWGDLPVLGCLLNIYAEGKIGYLNEFEYEHLSHSIKIVCGNGFVLGGSPPLYEATYAPIQTRIVS
jgi:hypothetical protein